MNKLFKYLIISLLILFLIIGCLYLVYLIDESPSDTISSSEMVELTVASEGPYEVDKLCDDIRTNPYYDGYEKETVSWLDSYGNCQILSSSDAYVLIDRSEISKIPILNANDVFVNETFECEIVENRSLGSGFKDILLVKNIHYKHENIKSMLE